MDAGTLQALLQCRVSVMYIIVPKGLDRGGWRRRGQRN